ncbi:prickle-like protein 4 [Limosa lapponica baueri]|uniref:Prickle-like protein 4 n=1 Tax=Limosa lapponica baueri TaxID=1758121 RepID=A0A2I0T9A1_LIMLA|nr:prickle-like protein 4 [Limosa lapponica baueri]
MEECIEAEGRRWHLEHFCCLECEVPLRGQRYVMKSGRPCCRGCFETLFAETCQACGDPIGADSEEATHQGLHWHARAACFCCSLCRKPLRGQPLTSRRGHLFCSETCSLGRDASSTASDSSDSAFASAPSPDSTPLARAGPAGRTAPGTGSSSVAGGCRQRVEGAGGSWMPGEVSGGAQTSALGWLGCASGSTVAPSKTYAAIPGNLGRAQHPPLQRSRPLRRPSRQAPEGLSECGDVTHHSGQP